MIIYNFYERKEILHLEYFFQNVVKGKNETMSREDDERLHQDRMVIHDLLLDIVPITV